MREIEFRVWLKDQKTMRNNVSIHCGNVWTGYSWIPLNDNIELMQYTGLKDKNGVKIFEGDIIQVEGSNYHLLDESNCLVVWSKCGYRITDYENEDFLINFRDGKCEIVGNIYDNPELLEMEIII